MALCAHNIAFTERAWAQTQQAQSVGRYVVTIPSLRQTRGDHP